MKEIGKKIKKRKKKHERNGQKKKNLPKGVLSPKPGC